MKVFASLAILATVVSAAPTTGKNRAPSPLDLKLEMLGNSAVKATLTNTGKNSLKVLRTGSILDSTTVEKAKVFDAANGEQSACGGGETGLPFPLSAIYGR